MKFLTIRNLSGLSFIYIFSILFWLIYYFLNVNNTFQYNDNISIIDWHKELQYLAIVKHSIINWELPFHVPNMLNFNFPERFLGTPLYALFLHSFGLLYLSEFNFHLLNHFIFYSMGFFGCLLFKKKFSLSIVSFFFLTITFNFYGGFVTKISAYGPSQLGYYMSPFIVFYLLKFSEEKSNDIKSNMLNIIFISLSLSLIIINGSTHFFVLWITFVTFWFIFNFKKFKFLILIGIFTFLLSCYKVLPASLVFGIEGNDRVVHGYTLNPEFFLQTFVSIRNILDTGLLWSKNNPFSYQEYSNYISIVGFTIILIFGLFHYLISSYSKIKISSFVLPIGITFMCAFENIRLFIIPDFLPLFNAESRTMGYISILVIILLFIATINFDDWYKKNFSIKIKFLSIFSLMLHTFYLFLNLFTWRLHSIQDSLFNSPNNTHAQKELAGNKTMFTTKLFIENDLSDKLYISFFYIGLIVSILSFVGITVVLVKLYFFKNGSPQFNQKI